MAKGILWATILDPAWIRERAIYPVPANHLHVTLAFGIEQDDPLVEQWIGKHITVEVNADCWNDRIQALAVTLPPRVPCKNRHPHITISMQNGTQAKESNDMLAGQYQSMPLSKTVGAVIEFSSFVQAQRQADLAKAFVFRDGKDQEN